MKSLKDLYKNHIGKISDKWSIYLDVYEDKLKKYQDLPINFFEIGVLNGGSLEIFSKAFCFSFKFVVAVSRSVSAFFSNS